MNARTVGNLVWHENVPLAPRTTFELGGPARFFATATSEDDVLEAVRFAEDQSLALTILGGGSNVIVPDDGVAGAVLAMDIRGVDLTEHGENKVAAYVGAGEDWDAFVARAVAENLAGVECLSGIPGKVGATPIQNVGAYGQDVAQTIHSVRVYDREYRSAREQRNVSCMFRYRDSIFKHERSRYIVLGVTFHLRRGGSALRSYAELANATSDTSSLQEVREQVLLLRRKKSMVLDPGDPNRRSAGSFFTNPIVSAKHADEVATRLSVETMPRWSEPDGRVKLSAAWLIERCGFARGQRWGAFGISSAHALALVHHGQGSTSALLDVADKIEHTVRERTGIALEREPVLL